MTSGTFRHGNLVFTVRDDQIVRVRRMAGAMDRMHRKLPTGLIPSPREQRLHDRAVQALAGMRAIDVAPQGDPPGGMVMRQVDAEPDSDAA